MWLLRIIGTTGRQGKLRAQFCSNCYNAMPAGGCSKNRSENVAQLTAYTFQEWKENNAGEFGEVDCVCCLDVIEEIFDVKAKATRVPNRPGGSD